MSSKIATYEPDNCLKKGYLELFLVIARELRDNKWLIWQLFKRDFFAMYKQSLLGVFWVFLMPVVSIGAFIMLNRSGVFKSGEVDVPYPLFAALGVCIWQIFAGGLIASAVSIIRAGRMVTKINVSKKSLVISACCQAWVSFIIQSFLIAGLFIYYRVLPGPIVLLALCALVPLMCFTLAMGLLVSLFNTIFRDIGNMLGVGLTFLMFLTPVLYIKPETGILAVITRYNPLYYFISFPRDIMLTGNTGEWFGYLISSIISIVFLGISMVSFHITETRLAERV